MKKLSLLIFTFGIIPHMLSAAGGTCSIENGPSEGLKNYLKQTDAQITAISNATKTNKCSGTFSNEKRFVEAMDRIDIKSELDTNFVGDFQYNIMIAAEGDSRDPVIRQGKIIHDKETKIVNALKVVANTCNLETGVSTNAKTAEATLGDMLMLNRKVEAYFKKVAGGDITVPDGTPDEILPLFQDIAANYSKDATTGCKNQYEFEELVSKLQGSVDLNFKNIGNSFDGWKKAIAMFRGTEGTAQQQQDLEKKLLSQELARQGLSNTAQSVMLQNLSCFRRDTNQTSTVESLAKTRQSCTRAVVQGLDNITKPLEKSFLKITNTEDYLKKLITIQKEKTINKDEIAALWTQLDTIISNNGETTVNAQMLSDLVSIHMQIVQVNKLLLKKIPDMQKNCMRQNPSIVGACR